MQRNQVVVHFCENPFEAAFMKGYLDEHGIRSWADGEDSLRFSGRYAVIGKGVRLFVAPKDARRAKELLENVPEPEELPEKFQEEPEDEPERPIPQASFALTACPNCGSKNIGRTQPPRLLNVLLFGLPRLVYTAQWYCADCDWQWD